MDITQNYTLFSSSVPSVDCNISHNCFSNIENIAREMVVRKESYLERSFGFLIIGIIGILANLFTILILGSSAKIRQKNCQYSYNSSKFCRFFSINCFRLV